MIPMEAYFNSLDWYYKASVKLGNGATVHVQGKGSNCVNTLQAKDEVSDLWHKIMSHFNLRTLKYMQSNGFVTNFPKLNTYDEKCETCQCGKSHRSFRAEDIVTSVKLSNSLATKAVNGKTPLKAWSGFKLSVEHLKVFGSVCFSHIPANLRSKLDETDLKGIFIGYPSQSKGYRVFNLETKKILVTIDVTFDEVDDVESDENKNGFSMANTNDDDVIKTKTLADVYERCNFIFVEPTRFSEASKKLGFQTSINEATLYMKKGENVYLLVVSCYVDDLLVMGNNVKVVLVFKSSIHEEFEMSNLGLMSYFLGMEINQNEAAMIVLRYVKSTMCEGLNYLKTDNVLLNGYSDSDWAESLDDMKSTSAYVFNLGSGAIYWSLKKKQVVAQSATEVE
ncbi:hypothetical protein F3Y22_tig00112402pilonHSYRG00171 [Hibiscus syriacus]|uniref:GAG-pre-integrase domain-containing protein n=1 Tax=Hibiscus syriacus TaxID=106335 RepID=A0A6A2XYG7_HIBSY|nr:hypothetical protein F3Y22_tig00112402pilonHSYRG00171 [Hibiscus syriacus]